MRFELMWYNTNDLANHLLKPRGTKSSIDKFYSTLLFLNKKKITYHYY
jgi:hypothetical protein